jgi:hypothetical protein
MFVSGGKSGQGSPLEVCDVFMALNKIRSEAQGFLEYSLWQNSVQLFIK